MQCLASDSYAIEHHLNIHIAVLRSCKYAICCDIAKLLIGYCPGNPLRKLYCVTGRTNADCRHLQCSTDAHIVIIAFDQRMVKCCRTGCRRNDHPRSADTTGKTIRRTVDDAQALITRLLSHKSSGTTAVQVGGLYAACLQQDLCQRCIAATGGEGLLTAVQNQKYYLTGLGKADSGTAGQIIGQAFYDLSILDQTRTKASNCFLDLALINGLVFFLRANHGGSILQDTHKARRANRLVFHAFHNQHTAGLTGAHIKSGTVGSNNYIIIFDIMLAVGVTMAFFCGQCLIKNTLHLPALSRIVIVVVGIQIHILAGNIRSCQIIYDLLAVGIGCHFDLLIDTRCQIHSFRREYGEQFVLSAFYIVTCQLADKIGIGIADSLTQSIQIIRLEFSGSLQCGNHFVGGVSIVNCIPNIITGANTVQTISQEVICTIFQCKVLGEIHHQVYG